MMEILIIAAAIFVLAIPFGILEAKRKERLQREEQDKCLQRDYREFMKELHKTDDNYHKQRDQWMAFYDKYKHLGTPSYTVGYANYKGWPWEAPRVAVPYDTIEAEKDLQTKVNYARNGSIDFRMEHWLPEISQTATFYKEARLAVLGAQKEFTPEQLRFIKSNTDKVLESIVVTITTTNIEEPTFTMYFPLDDRSTVDELKAAFNAFKALPKTKS